jgi:putative ABC transport system permease protein
MLLYYLRLAVRSALATPALTALTAGAIALGVAVPTALISIYEVFSRNPIPGKSDVLFNVRVDNWDPHSQFFDIRPGDPPKQIAYRDMRGLMASDLPRYRSGIGGAGVFVFPEDGKIRPYRTVVTLAHADFFPMFEVPFRFGGGWNRKADERPERVVVLSEEANERLYGGADSVGRRVRLGTESFTIVGVLDRYRPVPQFYDVINNAMGKPREFIVPFDTIRETAVGLGVAGNTDSWGSFPATDLVAVLDNAEVNWIQYWVELTPDRVADYESFLSSYAASQRELGRFPKPDNHRVTPVMEWMSVRAVAPPAARGLVVISLLFLAVCCLNLTGLLLGKFLARSGVLGVHRALGAPRSSIFLQRLLECELIGVAGGLVGLLFAAGGLALLGRVLPPGIGSPDLFGANAFSLGVAVALALAAGLASGIYPAWRACRIPPAIQLKLQ